MLIPYGIQRSLFLSLYSYPQSPSTSAARLPFIRASASLLSREDLVPSLSRSLPFSSFVLSRYLRFLLVPEGHVLLVLAVAEPAPTPRLFQTHFNSLPGFAVAEWHADKCGVREHATTRCSKSRNINMKIRARASPPFLPPAPVLLAFVRDCSCTPCLRVYARVRRFH